MVAIVVGREEVLVEFREGALLFKDAGFLVVCENIVSSLEGPAFEGYVDDMGGLKGAVGKVIEDRREPEAVVGALSGVDQELDFLGDVHLAG